MSSPQQCAVDALIERIDLIEQWARDIDREWPDRGGAVKAQEAVEKAWGWLAPCEDDGPALLACYARNLEAAVRDAVEAVVDTLYRDPRDRRTNGYWRTALDEPTQVAR